MGKIYHNFKLQPGIRSALLTVTYIAILSLITIQINDSNGFVVDFQLGISI